MLLINLKKNVLIISKKNNMNHILPKHISEIKIK